MAFPEIAYGTPRKLPSAKELRGRVVVLDIAFAAETGGASFEKVTQRFIDGLGPRLAMWIDHHDHQRHAQFAGDPRFVLSTKAEHPACPEMVTPERVAAAGPVAIERLHRCVLKTWKWMALLARRKLSGDNPY